MNESSKCEKEFSVEKCMDIIRKAINKHKEKVYGIRWLDKHGGETYCVYFLTAVDKNDEVGIAELMGTGKSLHMAHLIKALSLIRKEYAECRVISKAYKILCKKPQEAKKKKIKKKSKRTYAFVSNGW